MMWTIVLILAIMWILGMVTANTLGGLIHILLLVALVVVIIDVLRGRRTT